MDLGTLLRFAAERFPDHQAVVGGHLRLTYAVGDARVNAVAHALRDRGIARGARLVLCLKNPAEWLTAHFALQRPGAIAVPINSRFAAREVRCCVGDGGAAGIPFETTTRGPLLQALADGPGCRLRLFAGADPPAGAVPFPPPAEGPVTDRPGGRVEEDSACVRRFRPRVFVNHDGSTEIYAFTVCHRAAHKPGCAGRPGLHAAIRPVTAAPDRRVLPHETVKPGGVGKGRCATGGTSPATWASWMPRAIST